MKNLKISALVTVLLVLALNGVFAQALSLKSVCGDLAANPVTKGDFTQAKTVVTSKGSRELKSTGKFLFCLDGIVWNTEKPLASSMIITPTKITQISANGNKNTIDGKDNPTFASIASSLTAVFSGDLSKLEENFTVDFSVQGTEWKISLKPKSAAFSKSINSIFLSGNVNASKKAQMNQIEIVEQNGGAIKYSFTNQTISKELSSDEKAYFAK